MNSFFKDRKEYLTKTKGLSGNDLELRVRTELHKMHQLMMDCAPVGDDFNGENREGKGETRCNRTACQTKHHVVFRNDVMNANYCLSCAVDIRFSNLRDMDLYPNFNEELDELFVQQGWKP